MVHEFKLPDLGEGVAEGELVTWLVSEGDAVDEDQSVAEVETDKALVEIPSPVDGTVAELRAEEGEVVPVGSVLITFDVEGEAPAEDGADDDAEDGATARDAATSSEASAATAPDDSDSSGAGRTFAPPSVRRLARELGVELGAVAGSGPGGRATEADVRAAASDAETAATDEDGATAETGEAEPGTGGEAPAAAEPTSGGAGEPAARERTLAAPATRGVAREEGVDIDDVPASETRDGEAFVTAEDVRAYAAAQRGEDGAGGATAAAGAGAAGAPSTPAADEERVERVPYRGMRRAIGEQMVRSKTQIPHVTNTEEVDVTELWEIRADLKQRAAAEGVSLTFTPFFIKAVTAALKEFPALNAELDEENGEILQKHYYNIGVATATDAGLVVPVIDDADRKGMLQLASELTDKIGRARDRSIAREEMKGGTFTITNIGSAGGQYATPVINHPEAAILGFGSIREKPWVVDGEVVPRRILPLSLSFDHRVTDGATAAQFTTRVAEYLHDPTLLLLE